MWDALPFDVHERIFELCDVWGACRFGRLSSPCRALKRDALTRRRRDWLDWEACEPSCAASRDVWYAWLASEPEDPPLAYTRQLYAWVESLTHGSCTHCPHEAALVACGSLWSDVELALRGSDWGEVMDVGELAAAVRSRQADVRYRCAPCGAALVARRRAARRGDARCGAAAAQVATRE